MKERQILWYRKAKTMSMHTEERSYTRSSWLALGSMLGMLLLLLAACGSTSSSEVAVATPQAVRVNGFGTAANHPHSFLVFPDGVMVLSTHYGTFWSGNNGASWAEVAGGSGQVMDGLMSYSLTSSPFNPQRLYELTQPALSDHKGTLGLYTSTDQGRTWKMTITEKSLVSNEDVYLVEAGNDTPDEVYVYLPALGPDGLKVSKDAGEHFSPTGTLPFGNLTALLALPGAPGQLLAASSDGMARSADGGMHWQIIKSISGGIFGDIVTAGPGKPIYASGDSGVYASNDGGKTFKLVSAGVSYGSLTVSTLNPQMLYGRTGTGVYYSADGGKTWQPLPHVAGNLFGLVADPHNASQVYLSMSYPTEVYHFDQASQKWVSLTPKA
jgi:photosystem II stability/assembly factor-like uncharacterized protein